MDVNYSPNIRYQMHPVAQYAFFVDLIFDIC